MLQKSSDIIWKVVGEEVLLLDTSSAFYFSLNETGSEIWHLLEAGKSLEEIEGVMTELYDVDIDTIRRDIDALVKELQSEKILV